jgi:hypothetical protein
VRELGGCKKGREEQPTFPPCKGALSLFVCERPLPIVTAMASVIAIVSGPPPCIAHSSGCCLPSAWDLALIPLAPVRSDISCMHNFVAFIALPSPCRARAQLGFVFLALVAVFVAVFAVLLCLIPFRERKRLALSESQKALGKAESEARNAERGELGQPVLQRADSSLVVHFAASPPGPPERTKMPFQPQNATAPAVKPPNVQFVQVQPNGTVEPTTSASSSACVPASTLPKFSYNTSDMSIGPTDDAQAQTSTPEHKKIVPAPPAS